MITLDEFLKSRIGPRFTYQVFEDRLELKFDRIEKGEEVPAINLENEREFKKFHDLLNQRKVEVVGNYLAGKYIILNIKTWDTQYGIQIPTFDWN